MEATFGQKENEINDFRLRVCPPFRVYDSKEKNDQYTNFPKGPCAASQPVQHVRPVVSERSVVSLDTFWRQLKICLIVSFASPLDDAAFGYSPVHAEHQAKITW